MKVSSISTLLLVAALGAARLSAQGPAASAGSAGTALRVTRPMLSTVENSIDNRIRRLWDDNPLILLGPTRAVYLPAYGTVMTAEVNVVLGPSLSPMSGPVSKDQVESHRARKIERLPALKGALKEAIVDAAASLDTLQADEQVVLVAFLSKYPWEQMKDVPLQISLHAPKKRLLELQRQGAKAVPDDAFDLQITY